MPEHGYEKATQEEIERRVTTVYEAILDGTDTIHNLRKVAKANGWTVTDARLYEYRKRALKLMEAETTKKRKQMKAKAFGRRDRIYQRAMEAGKLQTALNALADTAKLQNLYASDREFAELLRQNQEILNRLARMEQLDAPGHSDATTPAEGLALTAGQDRGPASEDQQAAHDVGQTPSGPDTPLFGDGVITG